MTKRANDLLEEALRLPDEERFEFARRLQESVEVPADLDLGPEWSAEIARRIWEHENGIAKTIPWEEALRMIREGAGERPRTDGGRDRPER
jgi:putative addiction module component (TIGR02574 family)